MTKLEFSEGFDTLVNSYNAQINFGADATSRDLAFTEYEKSYFLTKAQDDFVVSLYNGRNSLGLSFEATEEARRYLANLVEEKIYSSSDEKKNADLKGVSDSSVFFALPSDLWFITYESVKTSGTSGSCSDGAILDVVPVTQDEYHKIKRNPFRGANGRRALRMDLSLDESDSVLNIVEIICTNTISEYYIRYIKNTKPIILEDLQDNGGGDTLKIKGEHEATDCMLPEVLHSKILDLAVTLALRSKGINIKKDN